MNVTNLTRPDFLKFNKKSLEKDHTQVVATRSMWSIYRKFVTLIVVRCLLEKHWSCLIFIIPSRYSFIVLYNECYD